MLPFCIWNIVIPKFQGCRPQQIFTRDLIRSQAYFILKVVAFKDLLWPVFRNHYWGNLSPLSTKVLTIGLNLYSFSIIFTPSNILLYILKFLARFSFWKFKYLSKERSTTVVFNLTNLTQKILYFYRTLHNNSWSLTAVYRPYYMTHCRSIWQSK